MERIGWIGTGVMGLSMCGHVMAKGYPTTIYSRTKSRAQPLLDKGAVWSDTPAGVAERSDIIFTIVGLPSDVREVYQRKGGIIDAARRGAITVDMTTTEPSLAREIYEAAKAKGRVCDRRAGVRRRRGGKKRDALDHGWRRRRRGCARDAVVPGDGQEHRPSGRGRKRTAHQDVQSDRAGRNDYRCLRKPALRLQGRPGPRHDARAPSRKEPRNAGSSTTSRRKW